MALVADAHETRRPMQRRGERFVDMNVRRRDHERHSAETPPRGIHEMLDHQAIIPTEGHRRETLFRSPNSLNVLLMRAHFYGIHQEVTLREIPRRLDPLLGPNDSRRRLREVVGQALAELNQDEWSTKTKTISTKRIESFFACFR